ncbi:kelch-like protein 25 [Plakobranchus ocellatus]|uniref:Kelch-like protein 25 n=1 Tax=Plakobranchus ocellatus TaxID=259542 RepID=A0AAV4D447_9GAST|nr:kelch-like protein 25 [Plakobranchus ocellatus]
MSSSDKYINYILPGMKKQLQIKPYEDVTIKVENETFPCHRFILSANSGFFEAMFRSGMREALDGQVELKKNISAETFRMIRDYIYFGTDILTEENVMQVWHASNQLQIEFLYESCNQLLKKILSKENCIDIYINSKLLNSTALSDLAIKQVVVKFESLAKTEAILRLDGWDMEKLVKDDNLKVESEDIVVKTILRWVKYEGPTKSETPQNDNSPDYSEYSVLDVEKDLNEGSTEIYDTSSDDKKLPSTRKSNQKSIQSLCPNERESWLARLLAACRMCLISGNTLMDLIADPIVINNSEAFEIVKNVLSYRLQHERRDNYCPNTAVYRNNHKWRNVLYISIMAKTHRERMPKLLYACDVSGEWQSLKMSGDSGIYSVDEEVDENTESSECNAVVCDGDIFITSMDGSMRCYRYKPQTKEQWELDALDTTESNHGLVSCKGSVYVIASTSIKKFNAYAEKNEPGMGEWLTVRELKHNLVDIIAAVLNNKIVILGKTIESGTEESKTLIQYFDPQDLTITLFQSKAITVPKKRVFVSHWSGLFLLEDDGNLWHLKDKGSPDGVTISNCGQIWDGKVNLKSAAIFKDELVVLENPSSPAPNTFSSVPRSNQANHEPARDERVEVVQLESSLKNVFKRVHVLKSEGSSFLIGVLPSRFFSTR